MQHTFCVIPETVGSETGDDWLKNDASDKNPYEPQIAQWLREDPDLSAAEILRRVASPVIQAAGALYAIVMRLKWRPDTVDPHGTEGQLNREVAVAYVVRDCFRNGANSS